MGEIPARHGDPGGLRIDLGLHHEMVQKLLTIPKPVVAAINGRCHGAGWVIALACDFRVAWADALVGDIRSSKAILQDKACRLSCPGLLGNRVPWICSSPVGLSTRSRPSAMASSCASGR